MTIKRSNRFSQSSIDDDYTYSLKKSRKMYQGYCWVLLGLAFVLSVVQWKANADALAWKELNIGYQAELKYTKQRLNDAEARLIEAGLMKDNRVFAAPLPPEADRQLPPQQNVPTKPIAKPQ